MTLSLVPLVRAENQAEAEFLQSLLLAEGVRSVLRRSAGSDVPEFLAAGPRELLVEPSSLMTARDILLLDQSRPTAAAPGSGATADQPGGSRSQ